MKALAPESLWTDDGSNRFTLTKRPLKAVVLQEEYLDRPDEDGNDDIFIVTTNNKHFEVLRPGFDVNDILSHKKNYNILPLFAYIHSGVALSLGRNRYPFTCLFDSGQIGWVLVRKGLRSRKYPVIKLAQECVDMWNQFLSGDVWYYCISPIEGGNTLDACGGFYGLNYAKSEAEAALDFVLQVEGLLEPDPSLLLEAV